MDDLGTLIVNNEVLECLESYNITSRTKQDSGLQYSWNYYTIEEYYKYYTSVYKQTNKCDKETKEKKPTRKWHFWDSTKYIGG